LPDGPMTIGIDGGFVRARRKVGILRSHPRTKVLDGDLEGVFRGWYPQFRPVSAVSPTP
jgi:hypothetical protein